MRTLQGKLFRYCTIAACAAVVANGCMLDRRPILSPGTIVPRQYCPGDTLVASYDFLRFTEGVCTPRAGSPDECTTAAPTVTMTGTPALFPPTTLQSYRNSVSFTASGDRVEVGFVYGASAIFVPPSRLLVNVRDHTVAATRIVDAIDTTLPHTGRCPGPNLMPIYMPVMVPGASSNLGLTQVCNPASNATMVTLTLSTDVPGESFQIALAPGECRDMGAPGIPAYASRTRTVGITTALLCGAGGDGVTSPLPEAPPISTRMSQACR